MSADRTESGSPDDAALWDQADEVFDRLLGLDPARRAEQLAAMTLPDAVRRRVERLLASDSQAGLLDDPDHLLRRLGEDPAPPEMRGRQVGEWILGGEIGRGGMSVVYAAERRLGGAQQQAALKLLTLGALAGHGHERFLREQDILARLEHPNIAALLDAGVLDDGTPWMAMARINGVHIDQWCRDAQLDVRAIVRLFLAVCDTVEFAHRNLVIHRDIKPSNVLVDADSHVYLLDFGIARLIEAGGDQATRTLAATPRYAAPEQFSGANPSTGMDVYGLGALLYCLLTGAPPRETGPVPDPAPLRLASRACTKTHRDRAKSLRGDLDALLARALASAPAERYATAGELAADLRNWLAGRPVSARRQSRLYRSRKFVARHKWGVAANVVLLLTLAAGVGASLWQARVARANAAQANAVKDFMVQIFEASAPDVAAGKDPPASELLKRGAARVRTKFARQPALRAQMLGVIGTTQQERGLLSDAESSLDDALKAYDILDRPSVAHAQVLKARASLYYDMSELDKSLQSLARADRIAAEAGLNPLSPLRSSIAVVAANVHIEAHHPEKTETRLGKLLPRMRRAGLEHSYNYVHGMNILGVSLYAQGRSEEAVALLRNALKAQAGLKEYPTLRCDILNDLGIAMSHGQRHQATIDTYRQAVRCNRKYYGEAHQATIAAMGNMAWILSTTGHADEAAEEYARLLPLVRRTVGKGASPDSVYMLAMMALARERAGRNDALAAMQQAYAESQQIEASRKERVRWVQPAYGLMMFERGMHRAQAFLGEPGSRCVKLDELTPLSRRICIAQWLLASDAGTCAASPDDAPPATMNAPDQRVWLAGYWLVRQRCAQDEATRQHAAANLDKTLKAVGSSPPWLARRLADVGPTG